MTTSSEAGSDPDPESLGGEARVVETTRADDARWDAFVDAHPEATFFHLAGWRQVLEDALGHRAYYLAFERGGEIRGVLPLVRVKSMLFGDALASTPFLAYGGPLGDAEAIDALLAEAEQRAVALGVDHLELRCRQRLRDDWPEKDLYVTFRRELAPEDDANLKAVPRKQRAMIRKGEQAGLRSEVDPDVGRFYPIFTESYRNLGTPVLGRRYFEHILDAFGERTQVLTVTDGDAPLASVMSFRFRDEILPYYGGGRERARETKANDFMYWEVMRRGVADGARLFDFGRSKVGAGSYRFKKHWGFEPEPLHYQYRLVKSPSLPDVNPQNPKYRHLIALWQRLPLAVSRAIGPSIARNLG